jgi:peptidyl-prolyl cis-trans isomerase C
MRKGILSAGFILIFVGLSLLFITKLFAEPETVVAKVGDMVITQRDFDAYLDTFAQMKKGTPFTPEEKKKMLDNMIKGLLITREAEKEKMDQRPEVKSKLLLYRSDLLIREYVNTKIYPLVKVTDEELNEQMKENPNLISKETLQLKEILVKTEKEAEEIYEELKKGGEFSKIAGERSIANSRVHGGNVRPLSRGQLPKTLEEVAFSLKKDEFSKPIKTDEGYYFLYLVDRKERSPEEMKRLEETIREKVKLIEANKKAQEMVQRKAEELRKATKIEVYSDRIQ